MPKPSCAWGNLSVHSPWSVVGSPEGEPDNYGLRTTDKTAVLRMTQVISVRRPWLRVFIGLALTGCATPQYAIRPTPQPVESAHVRQIEQAISELQAPLFDAQDAHPVTRGTRRWGFDIQAIVERLSRVTERPHLAYQAFLYQSDDPNAAALADGRIYLSTGMLQYLASRGSVEEELAIIVAHELAHTVAQHIVQRYQRHHQQQLLFGLLAAGTAAASSGGSVPAGGQIVQDVAGLLANIAESGYSQDQEFEADQLGVRYLQRAGWDPEAALPMLEDFSRFDVPWGFLRTHPYTTDRLAYLRRYLDDTRLHQSPERSAAERAAEIRHLRGVQRLYPERSISWKNLDRQIRVLNAQGP